MNSLERSRQTFKKGDIVSPFSNVKTSRGWNLTNIITAKVIQVQKNTGGRACQVLQLKVIDAITPKKEWYVYVNSNSVQLKTETYDIY